MTFRAPFLALAALCLGGCSNDVKLEPLPPAPVISLFKASAGRVARGAMVTLEWKTSDATAIALDQVGVGPVAGAENKPFGAATVSINAEALFVLSATNKRGVKVTALVTVGVDGGAAKASFAALPEVIPVGGTATLVWSAPGSTTLAITPMGGTALDLKGQLELGSIEVSPAATTLYTLTTDGAQKQATVGVAQAVLDFSVDRALALPGEAVTLSWKTTGAIKLTVGSPGRAALLTTSDPVRLAQGTLTATLPATPLGTVVPFTLSVEGAAAAVTRVVSVALGKPPEVKTFTTPEYARLGQKFPLAWTTANAETVELSTGGVVFWTSSSPAQAATGSLQLDTPMAPTDYTLTAKSALGAVAVTKLATVKPVGAVSVTTFTALPAAVADGGAAITLTWHVPNARRLRILGSDGHTVATARGLAAEQGTATAFPNGPVTYTLDADNTLEAAVTATQAVTVTTPASFGPAMAGPIFQGNPVSLGWTVGSAAPLVGYPHSDVVTQTASTGFADIAATGAALPFAVNADDATATFTPKDFESFVYGNRVSGPVTVSTNGFFVFGGSALSRATTTAIPNTSIERNFIAPFWTNLELGSSGKVYWQVTGEAPERVLVIQFDKVKVKGDASSELTFQARVHQTGVVSFEYKKLLAMPLPAHVIGVQGALSGQAAGGAADNVGLTLFGPKSSPLPATFDGPQGLGGFVKLAGGYLKVAFTPAPFVALGAIGITEVLYQPHAAISTTGEWFEVANTTSAPLNLNGWTIDFGGGSSHQIGSSVIVPAGGVVVLGQSAIGPLNDSVATAYQYGAAFSLAEPTGSVQLRWLSYTASSAWNSASPNNGGPGVSVGVDPSPYLLATDPATTAPHPLSCSSTATFGSQAPLQKGSPGALAGCFGYGRQSLPGGFFDISATGTALQPAGFSTPDYDEGTVAVDLTAAPFTHFGAAKTALTVSTNGWLAFKTTTTTGSSNRTTPSTTAATSGALAIFWDDLDGTNGNSGIYSKRIAAGEDPADPLPHWIIQWSHYSYWSTTDDLNFQVKLFDAGRIEYHYGTMISGSSANYATGVGATVWLENPTGSAALVSSINQPQVLPNTALKFTPN